MITYKSVKDKQNGRFSLVLLVCGFLLFLLSGYVEIAPFIMQLFGIALIVFAIQIMQRYVLSDFVYIIEDFDNGESVMNVISIQGQNKTTVCSISFAKCIYAGDTDKATVKTQNTYNYRQNVFTKDKFSVIYCESGENILIKLESDENFKSAIMARVNNI